MQTATVTYTVYRKYLGKSYVLSVHSTWDAVRQEYAEMDRYTRTSCHVVVTFPDGTTAIKSL